MRLLLPAVLACALVPGVLLGRRRDRVTLAQRVWRTIYWANLPLVPFVLVAAPISHAGWAVAAASACLALLALSSLAYGRARFDERPEQAAFALSAFWPNSGWLGVPLCAALLGPGAVPTATLYANVASAPHNFVVGGSLAAAHGGQRGAGLVRALRANHYLPATLLGLAWALSGLPHPAPVSHVASRLVLVTAPAAFFALGLALARLPVRPDRDVFAAIGFRLGLSPLLLAGFGAFVAMPRAFVLQAGMATGLNTLSLAGQHGLPVARVAPVVAWTTGLVLAASVVWAAAA